MSDENKTPETDIPEIDLPEIDTPDPEATVDVSLAAESTSAAAEESAALNDELERLRSVFQSELDKATEEANTEDVQPPIQELDEGPDPDDEDDEEDDDEAASETEETKKSKKKKKKSTAKKPVGLIVALVLVCVLIVLPLSTYFVLSIMEKNLNSYIAAVASAESAKDAETKVTKYEEALSYCTEDSKVLKGERQTLIEKTVVAKCEAESYSAAVSYMQSNLDEEARAKPKTKQFKQFLAIPDKLEELFSAAPAVLPEKIEKAGNAEEVDYDALAKELKAPELVLDETAGHLKALGLALGDAMSAADDDAYYEAMRAYLSEYQIIQNLGVTAQPIPEDLVVRLWEKGFAYETSLTLSNVFTPEMTDAITDEKVLQVINELAALKAANLDIYTLAEQQLQAGKTSRADLTAAIKADISDSAKIAVAKMLEEQISAMQAETKNNLSAAKRHYSTVVAGGGELNMSVTDPALHMASLLLTLGNVDEAYSVVTNYLLVYTEEDAAADAAAADENTADDAGTQENDTAAKAEAKLLSEHPDFKTDYDEIVALHDAKAAVEEVFSEAYYSAMYGGSEFDAAAVSESLDAVAAENTGKYVSAYINYYKYVADIYGDAEKDAMLTHILAAETAFGTHAIICTPDKAQYYAANGDLTSAFTAAKTIVAIDVGNDLANSLLSREQRIAGAVAEAKAYAQAGIDALGEDNATYCVAEAVICQLIEGSYADAYAKIKSVYETQHSNGTLTVDTAELMLAAGHLYKSADEKEQKAIDDLNTELQSLFAQSSITISENTQSIMDGTAAPQDIYLGEAAAETRSAE